jgi:hypothetical protein
MSDVSSAKKGKKDNFANVAFGSVTMSAANTLTFSQIQLAVGLFQGIALLLHRIWWYPTDTACREIVAATDELIMALTSSNRLVEILNSADPAILSNKAIVGIAAGTERQEIPIISDFTMLPGGGKLISANPIYLGAVTGGFGAAATVRARLEFTFVELADRDYLELIQSQFPTNIS